MKGYRTYVTLAMQFIAAAITFLYQFGLVGSELSPEQLTSIEGVLTSVVLGLIPIAAYFRSRAGKK